jgi:hypothetical protein
MQWNPLTNQWEDPSQQQLPQSSPLLQPEAPASQLLQAPGEFEAPHGEDKFRNPRRQLWAGMLMDMGNVFGSWNGSTFTNPRMAGTGFKMQNQAMSQNDRLRAANQQAQMQHQQAQNQYAMQVPQLANAQLGLEQKQAAHAAGVNPNMPDPYNQWVLAGSPGTYEDWLQKQKRLGLSDTRSSAQKNWGQYQQILQTQGPAAAEFFLRNMANPYGSTKVDGNTIRQGTQGPEILDPKQGWRAINPDNSYEVALARGDLSGTVESGKSSVMSIGEQNDTFEVELDTQVPQLHNHVNSMRDLANQIRSGKYNDTGLLEGRWRGKTTEEGARLAAKQTLATLQNLQITNLAPVTIAEIERIEMLFASLTNDPEANIGVLEEMAQRSENVLREYARAEQYYRSNNNTLRGYGRQFLNQYAPGTDAGGGQVQQPATSATAAPPTPGRQPIIPEGSTLRLN